MKCSAEEVLEYWFGGDQREQYRRKWFCSNKSEQLLVDEEIAAQYSDVLREAVAGEMDVSWRKAPRDTLALILVVDQFSRHIYRYASLPVDDERRKKADEKAMNLALELTSSDSWDSSFSTAERVFALMPFRHNTTIKGLKYVMSSIDSHEAKIVWEEELLSRFRKQTLRRLQNLEDLSAAKHAESILEREQFDADESDIIRNELVVAVDAFLMQVHCRNKLEENLAPVAISLSGGVDSMVICKILSKLNIPGGIVAIHIDYANREESSDEADYVEQYCRSLGGVTFFKRVVSEVTRGVTDRTEYEIVSREARYNYYKEIIASTGCLGIIFGHHEGDVQENVLSNVMRGCSPLYLSGMESIGLTNGVPVWRPLLNFKKEAIYKFAHKYGVPYFRDTTPSWSTRGKLRNQLLPLLVDMYGQGCLSNLAKLAAASNQNQDLMRANLYGPFVSTVERYDGGLCVQVKPYANQPLTFWKEALKELMHSLSLPLVRDKAVAVFMERLGPQKDRPEELCGPFGWLELRKNFSVHLAESGTLSVIRPEVLLKKEDLWLRNPEYDDHRLVGSVSLVAICGKAEGEEWELGSVGRWGIRAKWVSRADNDEGQILQEVQVILKGEFKYTLKIPASSTHLVLIQQAGGRKSSGQKPPPAIANVDLRLRDSLPLLVPRVEITTEKPISPGPVFDRYLCLSYLFKN